MSPRRQITYSERPNHAARAAHAKGEKAFRTYDTSAIRPKRSPVPTIIGIIALAAIIGLAVWGILSFTHSCTSTPMLPKGEKVEVEIVQGESTKSIAKTLADAGLISSTNEFVDRVTELGEQGQIHPGKYTLEGGMTIDELIAAMRTPVAAETFTVPEGSTLEQIAGIVEEASKGSVTAADFLAAVSDASVYAGDYEFLADAGSNSLEGFLFPKTYPIYEDSTADSIVRTMLDQFRTETASLDYAYAAEHGLSRYDVVKLASIIERETNEEYRERVASVFYNRLDNGIMLQSDATTAYYVGREVTPDDLLEDNPYNTYLNNGLPPTPICAPSLGCLQAACAPEQTNYLYFYIAPNSEGVVEHYFSETLEEHEESFM